MLKAYNQVLKSGKRYFDSLRLGYGPRSQGKNREVCATTAHSKRASPRDLLKLIVKMLQRQGKL